MKHRNFDPRRDAFPLVRDTWLAPGEQVTVFHLTEKWAHYQVPKRKPNGRPRRNPALVALLWILLFPVMIIATIGALNNDYGGGPKVRTVKQTERWIVSSSSTSSIAVDIADVLKASGVIVLTNARFAALVLHTEGGMMSQGSVMGAVTAGVRELNRDLSAEDGDPHLPTAVKRHIELPLSQFQYQGQHRCKPKRRAEAVYNRFNFDDGSSLSVLVE